MDAEDTTRDRTSRARLAAVFAAAALAIPGGVLVSNALAADGSGGTTGVTTVPIQESESPPDDRDCPEKDGDSGSSGESAAPSAGSQETAL